MIASAAGPRLVLPDQPAHLVGRPDQLVPVTDPVGHGMVVGAEQDLVARRVVAAVARLFNVVRVDVYTMSTDRARRVRVAIAELPVGPEPRQGRPRRPP